MSVMESLHRISEADLERWVTKAETASRSELVAAVQQEAIALGPERRSEELHDWIQQHDDHEQRLTDIGELLMLLYAKQTWHLGNALGRQAMLLDKAIRGIPEIEPVALAMTGTVRGLGKLQAVASGLRVVLDASGAMTVASLVKGWTSRQEATARIAAVRVTWLGKLMGRHAAFRAWTSDELIWERWQSICEATNAVAANGGLLIWQTEV